MCDDQCIVIIPGSEHFIYRLVYLLALLVFLYRPDDIMALISAYQVLACP
jgi:hypothetical protein